MKTLLIITLLLAACHGDASDSRRAPMRATEIVVGPHRIPIPSGWRDVHECRACKPAKAGRQRLIEDSYFDQARHPNIGFEWASSEPQESCERRPTVIAGNDARVISLHASVVNGDAVCHFTASAGDHVIDYVDRIEGDHVLRILWTHAASTSSDERPAWHAILRSLGLPTS